MKNLLLGFLFSFSCAMSSAQDINVMLKDADKLESIPNELAAFNKYSEIVKIQHNNVYALAKCSELCSRIGKRQTDKKAKEDFYTAAKSFAEAALKVNPNSSDANAVMAMALGHQSLNKSSKEKIATAKDVKKYADIAIKLDPANYKAWHILGRWNYEICNLNLFEKAAVKILYGGLPPASIKNSITAFETAQNITKTGFVLNCLELAKAYLKNNDIQKAKSMLQYMQTLPVKTEDDPLLKAEGKKMLDELK